MQFPNEPTFKDRLVRMTETFSFRLGAMVLLSVLFLAKEKPSMQVFGVFIAGWIVFEMLLKLFMGKRKE